MNFKLNHLGYLAIAIILVCSFIKAGVANEARLVPTPRDTEGPFYPVANIPLNANLWKGSSTNEDRVMNLNGQVLDTEGNPIKAARVEIWQTDLAGIYRHPQAPNTQKIDPNFTGFGATLTDENGRYQFQTIIPAAYPGRPPHIHAKVFIDDREVLTTQIYFKNHPSGSNRFRLNPNLLIDPVKAAAGIYEADFNFVIQLN